MSRSWCIALAVVVLGCADILGLDEYNRGGNTGGATGAATASSAASSSTAATGGGGGGGMGGMGGAPTAYELAVLADNPVAWWRLGESQFSEPAVDELGSFHGSYTGSSEPGVTGLLLHDPDTAVLFPTGSSEVTVPTTGLNFNGVLPFSIEAWIRPNVLALGRIFSVFEGVEGQSGANGYSLWMDSGGDLHFSRANAMAMTEAVTVTSGLVASATFYVVMTYDGTNACLIINAMPGTCQDGLVLGDGNAIPIIGGGGYTGIIDEVAIYATKLPAARIAIHYAAGL